MTVDDGKDEGAAPYWNWVQGQYGVEWQAVSHLKTPPFNTPYAKAIKTQLEQHGCQIEEHQEHYLITFPAGTKKKLVGPVTLIETYTIRLPDGSEIREQHDRTRDISIIALPQK
jgi:hypothetical protein